MDATQHDTIYTVTSFLLHHFTTHTIITLAPRIRTFDADHFHVLPAGSPGIDSLFPGAHLPLTASVLQREPISTSHRGRLPPGLVQRLTGCRMAQ